jgi:hypothetical protein
MALSARARVLHCWGLSDKHVCVLLALLVCRIETTRHVSSITIILSTVPLDTSAPGYQAPLPEDQVKEHVPAVAPPTTGTVQPPKGNAHDPLTSPLSDLLFNRNASSHAIVHRC